MRKPAKSTSTARGQKRGSSAKKDTTPRRSDWETNHARIETAFVEMLGELHRRPTNREIARRLKLHPSVVDAHVKAFDWSKFTSSSNLRALVPAVLGRLAEKLLLGELKDVRAREVKLFLEIIVGYRSPTEDDVPPGEMPDVEIVLPDNGRGDSPAALAAIAAEKEKRA